MDMFFTPALIAKTNLPPFIISLVAFTEVLATSPVLVSVRSILITVTNTTVNV